MLAGQGAARRDAHPGHFICGRVNSIKHAFLRRIEGHQRVEVAITGMEHVHDRQVVAIGDVVHLSQDGNQFGARHHGVMEVVVGGQLGHSPESSLAPLPQQVALGLIGSHPDPRGVVGFGHGSNQFCFCCDGGRVTGDFGQKHCSRLGREARPNEPLYRHSHRLIHHFQGGWDDPLGNDPGHGGRRILDAVKRSEQSMSGRRVGGELDEGSGHDPERAFRSDHDPPQIQPNRVGCVGAQHQYLTCCRYQLDGQHVIYRGPFCQAVGAAAVVGDVAADSASRLGRGVGCEVQTEGSSVLAEVEVQHTGTDPCGTALDIDLDLGQSGQGHDERWTGRYGAPGQARSGTTRHNGDRMTAGDPDDLGNLADRSRQGHDGHVPAPDAPIFAVHMPAELVGQDPLLTQEILQLTNERHNPHASPSPLGPKKGLA
jgi:hypothetical protein